MPSTMVVVPLRSVSRAPWNSRSASKRGHRRPDQHPERVDRRRRPARQPGGEAVHEDVGAPHRAPGEEAEHRHAGADRDQLEVARHRLRGQPALHHAPAGEQRDAEQHRPAARGREGRRAGRSSRRAARASCAAHRRRAQETPWPCFATSARASSSSAAPSMPRSRHPRPPRPRPPAGSRAIQRRLLLLGDHDDLVAALPRHLLDHRAALVPGHRGHGGGGLAAIGVEHALQLGRQRVVLRPVHRQDEGGGVERRAARHLRVVAHHLLQAERRHHLPRHHRAVDHALAQRLRHLRHRHPDRRRAERPQRLAVQARGEAQLQAAQVLHGADLRAANGSAPRHAPRRRSGGPRGTPRAGACRRIPAPPCSSRSPACATTKGSSNTSMRGKRPGVLPGRVQMMSATPSRAWS